MEQKSKNEASPNRRAVYAWVLAIGIGLAVGVGMGTAVESVGAGVVIGLGMGVMVGLLLQKRIKDRAN